MTASLLGVSFEAFVLDDEMHAAIYRMLRGVEVSDETLDYGAIRDAVLSEGHFLGGSDTLAAMERDYFYPALADRETPTAWEEAGASDARDRAKTKVREILATHQPEYLTPDQDAEIRRRFRILD